MKILVLSHMYPNEANSISGIFVHEQVKALVNLGHDVKVISPVPFVPSPIRFLKKEWKKISKFKKIETIDGIEIHRPRYLIFPKLLLESLSGSFMYLGSKKTFKKLTRLTQYDLIHAHVALPDGNAAMKISKLHKIPLVVTVHGKDFSKTVHKKKPYLVLKRTLNYSHKVVLISEKLEKLRKKHFDNIKESKISIIYNGVNEIFYTSSLENKKLKDKINILSVSNLVPTKGIDLNILAIAKLIESGKEVKYTVVGDGYEKKNLLDLTIKLGIQNHVEFVGRKNSEEVKKYMERCDIFSLPSWDEAFGIVYLEAMAVGKPVIGCVEEGIAEVISNDINGFLVKKKDISNLTELLMLLSDSEALRMQVGKNAKDTVLDKFTWNINAGETVKVFQEAINIFKEEKAR